MNETMISIAGNVATEIRFLRSDRGTPLASFRLASTSRRFDRSQGGWVDGRTTYVTVVCWRALAENVAASLRKGEPVVATGRLRVEPWERDDGRSGTSVEIEAQVVGHDLSRGTSAFRRTRREHVDTPSDAKVAEQLARSLDSVPLNDETDASTTAPGPGSTTAPRSATGQATPQSSPGSEATTNQDVGAPSAEAAALPTQPRSGGRASRAAAASSAGADQRAA
ncbi:single-stranded DNA-binding protein [Actinopolymorpha sp. B17G11]|uniref:single-stranded DNA-binding protein n=1 Tax=unclassified Actinopolymorpha TaxID=2627063 RepID=UPI0032D8FD77